MNPSISIQTFQEKYAEEIRSLIFDIQRNEFHIEISPRDQPDLFDISGFYQKGTGNFWVAGSSGKIVGTVSLLDIGNRTHALRRMFVHKEFRGPVFQTAALLLSEALAWAHNNNISEIYLGTTTRFLAAHRFYEKNDFMNIDESLLPEAFPRMKVDTIFYKRSLDIKNKNSSSEQRFHSRE